MLNPENINGNDVPSWQRMFEYYKKHEMPKYSKAEKIAFVKTMTDRLQLSLNDIRGADKSNKYHALNSVPSDLLPIEINLIGGEKCTLLGIEPVMTYYDDEIDNLQGEVIRLYIRRRGEEQPEDFLPPRKAYVFKSAPDSKQNLKPFFIPTINKTYRAQNKPSVNKVCECQINIKHQEKPSSSTGKKHNILSTMKNPSPCKGLIKEQNNLIKIKNEDKVTPSTRIVNTTVPIKYQEIDLTIDDESDWEEHNKHQKEFTLRNLDSNKKQLTLPTPITSKADSKKHQKEPTAIINKADSKKHHKKPTPSTSKADSKKHQEEPTPCTSKIESKKHEKELTPSTNHPAEPLSHEIFNDKTKKYTVNKDYYLSSSSSDFLSKFQIVGLIETESVNVPAPDVQIHKKEHRRKQKHTPINQNEPEITSLLMPVAKRSDRIMTKKKLKKEESDEKSNIRPRQDTKKRNQSQKSLESKTAQKRNSNKARLSKSLTFNTTM